MWNGSKRPRRLPVYITEKEFSELLGDDFGNFHMPKPHRVACMIAWGGGLRISEILNLEQKDIDFDEGIIRINLGKGGKDRQVPIPKYFKKDKHLKFIPFKFEARALQKMFKKAAERSGLLEKKPRVRFHSLRHGFAVQCLKKGISLKAIQKMLGHGDLSSTGVYLELTPEDILSEYKEKF